MSEYQITVSVPIRMLSVERAYKIGFDNALSNSDYGSITK